jgi:hypothetical protein
MKGTSELKVSKIWVIQEIWEMSSLLSMAQIWVEWVWTLHKSSLCFSIEEELEALKILKDLELRDRDKIKEDLHDQKVSLVLQGLVTSERKVRILISLDILILYL